MPWVLGFAFWNGLHPTPFTLDSADHLSLHFSLPGVKSSRRSYDQPGQLQAIAFATKQVRMVRVQ